MKRKKQLKELTLKDNFMFGAVDEGNTRYNVEMQVAKKAELGKRVRYYHGQIDMELLLSGSDYTELPDVYVIFICDFDPFGKKKYRYTFTRQCEEQSDVQLQEGCKSIFLSTRGENAEEVPEELVKFLNFVKADLSESETDFEDGFVKKLQETIRRIKSSREMEERFMIFEEMLRDERAEGKAEGKIESILELLEEMGQIPDTLQSRIINEKNLETLTKWLKLAAKSDSLDEFLKKM